MTQRIVAFRSAKVRLSRSERRRLASPHDVAHRNNFKSIERHERLPAADWHREKLAVKANLGAQLSCPLR